jgi:hypothetical protein
MSQFKRILKFRRNTIVKCLEPAAGCADVGIARLRTHLEFIDRRDLRRLIPARERAADGDIDNDFSELHFRVQPAVP